MKLRTIPRRAVVLVWRVMAVVADNSCIGDCGHEHATDLDAVRCPWTPTPWPEVCDLLVRQVRVWPWEQRRLNLGGW